MTNSNISTDAIVDAAQAVVDSLRAKKEEIETRKGEIDSEKVAEQVRHGSTVNNLGVALRVVEQQHARTMDELQGQEEELRRDLQDLLAQLNGPAASSPVQAPSSQTPPAQQPAAPAQTPDQPVQQASQPAVPDDAPPATATQPPVPPAPADANGREPEMVAEIILPQRWLWYRPSTWSVFQLLCALAGAFVAWLLLKVWPTIVLSDPEAQWLVTSLWVVGWLLVGFFVGGAIGATIEERRRFRSRTVRQRPVRRRPMIRRSTR